MIEFLYDSSGNLVSQARGTVLPPQIKGQPVSQIVQLGQIATFSVVVADANGLTYQWMFNDVDIPGATGDSLLLTNVTAANAGDYSVVVTNSAGSLISAVAALVVGKDGHAGDTSPELNLVAYSDPGGTVTVAPMKLDYDFGETVTLTATSTAPNTFIGWAGNLDVGDLTRTTNPVSFVMNRNRTVRAKFASAVSIASGLVAFWRGEGDAIDSIGGHDGMFFAGTSPVAPRITRFGKVGGAFAFDGEVHVRVPHSIELTPTQMTAEAWILPTMLSSDHQTVVARGSPTNEDDAWWIGVFNGKPRFWSKHLGMGELLLEAPSAIPLNAWTHLAISFDGSTKCLYVNGIQVASQRGLGALIYEPAPVPVTIGSDWGFNASSARFSGLVDEVALYDRALGLNEIFEIFSADFVGKDVARPYFVSSSRLADAVLNVGYSQQLKTIFGTAPISFSINGGALPPGFALTPAGTVSGAGDTLGTFDFTVMATDAAGKSTEQLCILHILPSLPAGVAMQLESDSGLIVDQLGHLTLWADSSGRGHNASAPEGSGPLFVKNALNGKPVLRFDGTSNALIVQGQVLSSQQFSLFAVINDTRAVFPPDHDFREVFSNWRSINTTATSVFLGTTAFGGKVRARFTDDMGGATDPNHRQEGIGEIPNPSAYFILSGVSDTSDAKIFVNDTLLGSHGAALATRDLTTTYRIGTQGGQFEFWHGDIVTVLVFDRALSADEANQVWVYLTEKYFSPPLS